MFCVCFNATRSGICCFTVRGCFLRLVLRPLLTELVTCLIVVFVMRCFVAFRLVLIAVYGGF